MENFNLSKIWKCSSCKKDNGSELLRCGQCRKRKPEGTQDVAVAPTEAELACAWREHVDSASGQLYYHNTLSGVTQWERPPALGPTPYATGWFGRGSTERGQAQVYAEKNKMHLTKPARKQKEAIISTQGVAEVTSEYNIWYGKYYGDYGNSDGSRERALGRCVVETDAGWTKADKMDSKSRYFCLHFAHGMCVRGKDCQYFHRIPTPEDVRTIDSLHDCFGRERHKDHRDDMGGVGSFTNPSRTLYIGGLTKAKYGDFDVLKECLHKHFSEWGEVENINLIPRLLIAFVRYRLRANCEFAKEAMANQSLDGDELLNVRWANDDPNPVAKASAEKADFAATMNVLEAQGIVMKEVPFDYPQYYDVPDSKRQRIAEEEPSYQQHPQGAQPYPNTDHQYPDSALKNDHTLDKTSISNKRQVKIS
mmetsp:Transcript_12924/g.17000  ORF Transcript_12924/g.17000 Transcript_12924/m.17000 type:complete len:422 (+) Transcript_12924:89-1354(+)